MTQSAEKSGKIKITTKSYIREIVEIIGLAVIFAILIRGFIIQAFYIPSGSMMNTLIPGDKIIINKLNYLFNDFKRGDIIVFKCPTSNQFTKKKDFIKRIIGLSGDELEIIDNKVVINGTIVDEPYLYEEMDERVISHTHYRWDEDLKKRVKFSEKKKIKIPEGYLFMMGDNRNNSRDSRFWGFLSKKDVKGKAFIIYWPPSRFGIIR